MKVIGIDPGYDRLGVAVLEKQDGNEHVLYSTCVETDKDASLSSRIYQAALIFKSILSEHQPDAVALETIFFNKNQKTAIGVAEMRGVLVYLAQEYGAKVLEFGPQEVKVAVTGYGKSDKSAVIDMVKRLAKNVPSKALDDEYDAIAVGITALAHHR